MTALQINDNLLPGLERVFSRSGKEEMSISLKRSTGNLWSIDNFDFVKFRYRPERRAVIQIDSRLTGPIGKLNVAGSIWLHAGEKSRKIKTRYDPKMASETEPPANFFEPNSKALVEFFPYDHRVPQIADFLRLYRKFADVIFDEEHEISIPECRRYRPGLGATFQWSNGPNESVFVKITSNKSQCFHQNGYKVHRDLRHHARFQLPNIKTVLPEVNATVLEKASGTPFDIMLSGSSLEEIRTATKQTIDAFKDFHSFGPVRNIYKDRYELISRSFRASKIISFTTPEVGAPANRIADWIQQTAHTLPTRPAHMDVKPEHLILDENQCTILDLDSTALSDPLYDYVMLKIRIWDMAFGKVCSFDQAKSATNEINSAIKKTQSCRLHWLTAVATLQVARHHAQSLKTERYNRIISLFEALTQGYFK